LGVDRFLEDIGKKNFSEILRAKRQSFREARFTFFFLKKKERKKETDYGEFSFVSSFWYLFRHDTRD